MSATAGEALLSKCTLIWIGRDARRFEQFKHSDNVLPLLTKIKEVVQHPDPCFPKTWAHPQTGRRVVTAVELGDCMTDQCWRKAMWEPASTGALQSHRRAWHIADLYDRTAWCMIIEDDITLRANALDQLEFVFDQVATNKAQCLMLKLVPACGCVLNTGKCQTARPQLLPRMRRAPGSGARQVVGLGSSRVVRNGDSRDVDGQGEEGPLERLPKSVVRSDGDRVPEQSARQGSGLHVASP